MDFPIFLKPDVGQGSKGTFIANTMEDIHFMLKKDPTLLALEYLPGKEYTIDCFTNKYGKLLFAKGRERKRIYNGISVNSKPIEDIRFQKIAEIINDTLSLQGVWFYQVKESANGEFVLMEIAPRIAGTMSLFRVCGVNFIELSLFDRMSSEVSIIYNDLDIEIDRSLFSCFSFKHDYEHVYIDFDDTIIVNNAVNTNMMKFIYQCKNINKKITILSKHRNNIQASLKKFAISDLLFDEIIILGEHEAKASYITAMNSIFIDDSFTERKQVFDSLHIPVFALDALEALLYWKV
jgi:hypothetical protein